MANAKNIRIAYQFWSDALPFLTYTSESGNMLASNLQNQQPSSLWRSSSLALQVFKINLKGLRQVSLLSIYNHNFSITATVRLELAMDADFTNVIFDQTYKTMLPIYGIGQDMLGISPLGGYSTEGISLPYSVFWITPMVCRYARVSILDAANSSGYIQCGRLVVGNYWTPTGGNLKYGYELNRVTTSKQIQMDSGATRASQLATYREMQISFEFLTAGDELTFHEILQKIDLYKNILVAVYPEEGTSNERLHTMLCFLVEWHGTARDSLCSRSGGFKTREAL